MTERAKSRLPAKLPDGSSPALDFVTSVCHVLGLDPAVREAVYNLKCNLLRLLGKRPGQSGEEANRATSFRLQFVIVGVGEFASEAVWKDRAVCYVIPQLICKVCNHCRDVDLGRDPFRSATSGWLCSNCRRPYDGAEIEAQLLETVGRKFLAHSLQDLQCKKCAQVPITRRLSLRVLILGCVSD